jgi:signal transduction histidine kinase
VGLTRKIWLLVTIPFVVSIACYLVATRPFRRELLLAEAARDARDDVVVLGAAIEGGLVDQGEQQEDLTALVESIARAERIIGIAVFRDDGTLLAASSGVRDRPIDQLARAALASRREVREIGGEPPILEHAFLLERAGNVAVAVVVRDVGYVDALVGSWTRALILVGLGFVIALLALSGPVIRRLIGRPLEAVVHGVERVQAGDLDVHVPDARRDELGSLARSFNAMTESLRAARARVDQEASARAALEARLRHLQTLAAAGEVAASLGHEIGSPLNVILGRTRMVAARPEIGDLARRDLEIIAQQTERITRVVRKLLEISRPSRGRIEEVDVVAVVDETLAFVAPESKKRGITTERRIESGAPRSVIADRDQLVQIVFNLCHNAIQAQPSGGRIAVVLRRSSGEVPVPASHGATSSRALLQGDGLEIRVDDAGPGVAPELRGRIFDPFVTTKRGEGGTGLGLAIVDGMARALGGRVEVDEAPGGGASFRVTIPVVAPRSHSSSGPPSATAEASKEPRSSP